MKFTVDGETFELDESRVTFAEGRAMERVTGLTTPEIGKAAAAGSLTAIQAFIWVAMKRARPQLQFSDLDDMAIDDVDFESAEDEVPAPDPTPESGAAS